MRRPQAALQGRAGHGRGRGLADRAQGHRRCQGPVGRREGAGGRPRPLLQLHRSRRAAEGRRHRRRVRQGLGWAPA
eukprot:1108847-Alexandrium_andersonii.AAC.1